MNRRWFVGASLAAVGSVFVPKYGRWYRATSGLVVPDTQTMTLIQWQVANLAEIQADYFRTGPMYRAWVP